MGSAEEAKVAIIKVERVAERIIVEPHQLMTTFTLLSPPPLALLAAAQNSSSSSTTILFIQLPCDFSSDPPQQTLQLPLPTHNHKPIADQLLHIHTTVTISPNPTHPAHFFSLQEELHLQHGKSEQRFFLYMWFEFFKGGKTAKRVNT
ncbi:hypothetical protein Dimus_010087 [Dionaea muscipula]